LRDGDRMRSKDGNEKDTGNNAIRNLHRRHIRMSAVYYSI
jgi:hypothetical protein